MRSVGSSLALALLPSVACVADEPEASTSSTPPGSTGSTSAAGSTGPAATDTTASSADGGTGPGVTTGEASSDSTGGGIGPIFDVGTVPDVPEPPLPATDIEVVITADNAYAFGYGSQTEMSNYFGGLAATLASEIFGCATGPESYLVPAEDTAQYLYIVAYADNATTQGVLGQFRRVNMDGTPGEVVYTGDPGWEVCATGIDYGTGDPTPTLQVVNEQIALCNAGTSDPATTSQGWVDEVGTALGALAVGETNDTPYAGGPQPGNEFPLVCQTLIDPQSRWMWFNWDPAGIVWPVQSPFIYPGGGGNPMHDFMIFRLASASVPQPPAG